MTRKTALRATLAGGLRALLVEWQAHEANNRRRFLNRTQQEINSKSWLRDSLVAQRAGVDRRIRELDREIYDIKRSRELYFEIMGKE